jgi:curved DNA-binding protein CbpA
MTLFKIETKPAGPLLAQAYKTLGALPDQPKGSRLSAKERYMRLVLKYHPDRSTSAAFRRIQAAWETSEKITQSLGLRN